MGRSNQFPNMGGPMPGYIQFGQNTSKRQPGNSPGFQDGSNAFFGQMPFPDMYQPQMPTPQDKTGWSNEQYKQYVSKCLISVMLNKVQHTQEQMKMQMFMQQFKLNFQNNPNYGKLVSKMFANHFQRLYAFVTQSLKKIKTMKVREKRPKAKKTKMMSQRLL